MSSANAKSGGERDLDGEETEDAYRERRLEELCTAADHDNPERLDHIAWFLDRDPRHLLFLTPLSGIDPARAPEAHRRMKARWLELVAEAPADPDLARRAAHHMAGADPEAAASLIRSALSHCPGNAELWTDLGRCSREPRDRLAAFDRARTLNPQSTYLWVWIAVEALEAGNYDKAEEAAAALGKLIADARAAHGDMLDWPERGRDLWKRLTDAYPSRDTARKVSAAIADHAYFKHHFHTISGMLAGRNGDWGAATDHLIASGDVVPDHRLSAYGPSLILLREVCAHGYWEEGDRFLRKWKKVWDDPRADEWIAAINDRRLPGAKDNG
ncbi:tetratricopeptide repeat protein [Allosphingosinicella flava]|uniref:Tetratricopeptide repeat protein n=1 Tax=Allosphingosinicella flava TaxID=2771430 RepID=A0A7T2GI47_9SPHN|nr:tetratricopeptide repeat protein [Sphingosinicella flava]QPQ54261.1 tetratricopeptide repeat protein [Sphingosinicella flava]